jgi:FkbM family methyltransferase
MKLKHYWNILRNHKRPLKFIVARLLMAGRLSHVLLIRQQGYRLRFHNANLSSQLWIDPAEREEALVFFRAYLAPGDRVVDVGANVGDTVLTSSTRVGAEGRVTAIEAHPRIFGFLEENVRLNEVRNVELVNCAVGAVSGEARFSDERRDDMNRVDAGDLRVRMERLDDLVADDVPVALLKIDVEGYEKFVLDGGVRLIQRTLCVFFEVSAGHFRRYGYATSDVLDCLVKAGFRIYRMSGRALLAAVPSSYDPEQYENLVALRDEEAFVGRTGWKIEGIEAATCFQKPEGVRA